MNHLPLASRLDSVYQRQAIEGLGYSDEDVLECVSQFPSVTIKTVTSTASVLMCTGSANATNRRALRIRNVGSGVALINGANKGGGIRLLPGQTFQRTFDEDETTITTTETSTTRTRTFCDVQIYARAETTATDLEIQEA